MWATLWAVITLVVLTRAVGTLQLGMSWSAVLIAGFSFLPVFPLLAGLRSGRRRAPLLAALVAGYAIPFLFCGMQWGWMPWTLAVGALCAFRDRAAWLAFGLVFCGAVAAGLLTGGDAMVYATMIGAMRYALAIFGLYALAVMVEALHTTRADLTRGPVRQEQRRLDSDLRGVVGSGLRKLHGELNAAIDGPAADRPERLQAAIATARRTLAEVRGTSGSYRQAKSPAVPVESPNVARRILAAVYGADTIAEVVLYSLREYRQPWTTVLVIPWCVVVGVMLLAGTPSHRRLTAAGLLLVLPTVIGIAVSNLAVGAGVTEFGFLAGVVLVRVRRPYSQTIAGLIFAVFVALHVYVGVPFLVTALEVNAFAVLAFATYALLRLAELVRLLHQARADLIREAVLSERTRIARDLHDVLSSSLAAIALKGELCQRLLAVGSAAAGRQLAELSDLADRAVAELASLADRPVDLRLHEEVTMSRAILTGAGVRVDTTIGDLAQVRELDGALAAVLREAVTNIVKHADARTCSITVLCAPGDVRLRVVNDGVRHQSPKGLAPAAHSGSGLLGMAERVERSGGRLAAGPVSDGVYEVVAEFRPTPLPLHEESLAAFAT
ncbi:hypothetical protein GCM10009838_23380 [Catenulispora subtropica]|uniref:Signal transduction histidine kinase subgroup 3 dimerisation and phosphoacceptor domain-containing protein n=1 Tax=Catenulispora subtropica TaxID=450798 RepID=A0ABN2R866_9ACTN